MSDRARADENEKLVLQYHTENAELKAQVKKLEGWLGRGVSSNPHDHGMVCTGPIEGGPGMGWRPQGLHGTHGTYGVSGAILRSAREGTRGNGLVLLAACCYRRCL